MKCFKCGFETNDTQDQFCENCGHEYNSNYCTNSSCDRNDRDDPSPCNETACFCPDCGAKTKYFDSGIIDSKVYN